MRRCLIAAALLGAMGSAVPAQQGGNTSPAASDPAAQLRALLENESYVRPPDVIQRLVTAPRHLNVSLTQPSPDRRHFLKQESEGLPTVQAYGKPHLYFAGLQVDPAANRARQLTTRGAAGLELIDATTGTSTSIETPRNATVSSPAWSPDGQQLAYIANFDNESHIFVADVATGKSRQLTRAPLLATLVSTVDWTGDGRAVVAVLIPDNRKPRPVRPPVATGPQVRTWLDGRKSPQRNFWSLLDEPYDMELMEWFTTGQLALIDVKSRAATKVGAPGMIRSVDVGPEGKYFRVTTMRKPFSYVVQYNAFGTVEEIWNAEGKVLAEIQKRGLREWPDTSGGQGRGGAGGGGDGDGAKRGLTWMPDGQGMHYIEAQPGARRDSSDTAGAGTGRAGGAGRGGGGGTNNRPDRVVRWNPPFGPNDTTVLYRHAGPLTSVLFTDDAKILFGASVSGGQGELFAVNLAEPTRRHTILRQRGWNGGLGGGGGRGGGGRAGGGADDSLSFYANPGNLMTRRGTRGGQVVVLSSDSAVFLQGTRYFPNYLENAPREFIDKVAIATGQKTNVFSGAADLYENVTAALDDDLNRVVVIRESRTQVPDSWLRDMRSGQLTRLTNNKDYTPEFTNAVRRRVVVTRPDGIRFVTRVTLPADWREGTRLPALFWLYPYEYTSQAEYDRTLRNENVNRFPNGGTRTMEYLVTQGYAVVNFNPPIIGESGRMNDNYVNDLRMNLYAIIDELDRQGMIDRQRLGIGGHSYGAFSTANAMVHTPFFKAGIAGDGMYNRTLTPTGFQSERRDLWEGQETYLEMSPMLYADQLQGALLLYHGMEDQNVGTNLISSIRMMQALRAYGKTSALYMYPYEDHGPATQETLLDLWGRWTAWLDLYVKNAGKGGKGVVQ
jgi:dipeptidyl aminopeptidase/acylaminoacyl peptidase